MNENKLSKRDISLADIDLQAGGRCFLPLIIFIGYGIWQLFELGISSIHASKTWILIIGGVISLTSIQLYAITIRRTILHREIEKSFSAMLSAMSGFIPYIFSLYIIGYLGFWRLKELISAFSFWVILSSLFWIIVGYRILRQFWILTEIGNKVNICIKEKR